MSAPADVARGAAAPAPPAQDRFRRSRRLCWVALCAAVAQSVAVIIWPSPEAAQVTTVVVPAYLALVAGWTGISNWAEVRRP